MCIPITLSLLDTICLTFSASKKARFNLAEYQRLKSRREREKMIIKALKEKERMTSAEQDKTQAIEQSLLTQIGELEKYHTFLHLSRVLTCLAIGR